MFWKCIIQGKNETGVFFPTCCKTARKYSGLHWIQTRHFGISTQYSSWVDQHWLNDEKNIFTFPVLMEEVKPYLHVNVHLLISFLQKINKTFDSSIAKNKLALAKWILAEFVYRNCGHLAADKEIFLERIQICDKNLAIQLPSLIREILLD